MRKTLCKLRTRVQGEGQGSSRSPCPGRGEGPAPPGSRGNTVGAPLQPSPPISQLLPWSLISRHRQAALRASKELGGIPRRPSLEGAPPWGLSISGSAGGRQLLDGLHHQDLALALGDLVQREHSLVRGQVEGAANRGGHGGRDGPALHHAAGPHEVAAGGLLVGEGLRSAQARLVPLDQIPDSGAAGAALARQGPGFGRRVGHAGRELQLQFHVLAQLKEPRPQSLEGHTEGECAALPGKAEVVEGRVADNGVQGCLHGPALLFTQLLSSLSMLWGPHEPHSKEVLEIIEQCVGDSETLVSPNRGLTRSSHHKARAVQADAGQAVVGIDALGKGQFRGGPLNHSNQGYFQALFGPWRGLLTPSQLKQEVVFLQGTKRAGEAARGTREPAEGAHGDFPRLVTDIVHQQHRAIGHDR
uniref:Uncharacterized protein C7orf43 homolog isoform X1 n=1 Tax=Sus scrofa TaxID=9823 RepID=A0A480HJZ6_PIG